MLSLEQVWNLAKEFGPGGIAFLLYLYWRQQVKLDKLEIQYNRMSVATSRALDKAASAVSAHTTAINKNTDALYAMRNRLPKERKR